MQNQNYGKRIIIGAKNKSENRSIIETNCTSEEDDLYYLLINK